MRRTTVLDVMVLTVALWALVAVPAGAYIDGGSTMVVFQWLVAGLAATWFSAKLFWGRIVRFLRRDRVEPTTATDDEDGRTVADHRQA